MEDLSGNDDSDGDATLTRGGRGLARRRRAAHFLQQPRSLCVCPARWQLEEKGETEARPLALFPLFWQENDDGGNGGGVSFR